MPQETNLNVSPYFDDFNEDKNFNRVLFKPASPVQARELTQLQSILQGQIEKFGRHFFKEGSQVIPGQIAYDSLYYAVEVTDSFFGIDVVDYLEGVVGKTIRGENSGVEAKVVNYVTKTESSRGTNTLYVKYTKSGNDFVTTSFLDGENLIASTDIEYGNSRIIANNPFASCIPENATCIASAAKIEDGVYFIRGFFVRVLADTVILDQYTDRPNARVGLFIEENLVTAYADESLFDNAGGFSNFAAPGADRLQIKTTLIKKDLDEFNDENFVELLRIENGVVQKLIQKTDYNLIRDELARRTYDESGDYYIKPFQVTVKESLNDRVGNGGVYFENQQTAQGNTPGTDLMTVSVSPGKAYVKGYDIEKISNTLIDLEKPRTIKTIESAAVAFDSVSRLIVNNVYGSPAIGFGTTATVSLRSERVTTGGTTPGIEVGVAKVYDYKLEAAAYANDASKYDLFLYDLQTFTTLTVSSDVTLTTPVRVEGARSGATAFLKDNVSSSKTLTLTDTSGTFIVDEPLFINGIRVNYVVTSVREYSFGDVKSLQQQVGVNTFTADLELSSRFALAPLGSNFTIGSAGIVTAPGQRFSAGIRTGDIVTYNRTGFSDPTFNRVSAISSDGSTITIVSLGSSVSGVCDGGLTTTEIQTSDFTLLKPTIIGAQSSTLLSDLPQPYISSVDLTNATIQIRKQYTLNIASNRGSVTIEDRDLFFQPFDEERYNLVYSDGTVESLTSAKVVFNTTFKNVSLRGLSKTTDTNAVLVATLEKVNIKSKTKNLTRCSKTVINRSKYEHSGSTGTSFNNGLTYNTVYGTRVEDDQICINVPDGIRVHAVFESSTVDEPTLPQLTLINRSSDLTDTLQGEIILGSTSGAVARVVDSTTSTVDIVYENELRFTVEESVVFKSSGITGSVSNVVIGDKNIVDDFTFDNGQRPEYLDYSRIVRDPGAAEPSRQLAIIYDHFTVDTGAGGDLITVNSYPPETYDNDLPSLARTNLITDFIDVRPRVKNYSPSSDTDSPFEYDFRDFSAEGTGVPNILIPDETLNLGYSYYLGRTDKLILNKLGTFEIKRGAPSERPLAPEVAQDAFTVATIFNFPYVRQANAETRVVLSKHKRYTMFDIARLEQRVENIEFYSQLSLLETDTANLNIKDATTGLDRFKSGFFVDNFRSHTSHNIASPIFRSSIEKSKGYLRPLHYTTAIDLLLGSEQVVGIGTTANPNADLTQVSDLQSNSLRKTGDLVTLDYTENAFVRQNFATKTENVNPFAIISWGGGVQLNPASDVWVDERNLAVNNVEIEGSFDAFMTSLNVDPNTGLAPIDWGAWEEEWRTLETTEREISRERTNVTTVSDSGWRGGWGWQNRSLLMRDTFQTERLQTINIQTGLTRSGVQLEVNERIDTESLGTRLVNNEIVPFIRSRNVEFVATRIKPRTQFYTFFDGVDVTSFTTPKLLEITMQQGVFQVGETVVGTTPGDNVVAGGTGPEITFRVAAANHKLGAYDDPTTIYDVNPYSDAVGISSVYSATSSILNVDTASLQLQVLGDFRGFAAKGMRLIGQTSGAEATINDLRLITDEKGTLIGSYFIPDINTSVTAPSFETGTRSFRVTSSPVNSLSPADNPSSAESLYRAEGTINTFQEDVINVRNADIQRETFTDDTVRDSTIQRVVDVTVEELRDVNLRRFVSPPPPPPPRRWGDPLAQSFEIPEENGAFITSVDIFFSTRDANIPVTCQIRTMKTGLPTSTVVPFGEVTLEPAEINLSTDGTVPTRFTFPSPVFLAGVEEYAIVLISNSNDYNVFIAEMEQEDLTTASLPESERTIVSQQPYMGSLFKSQNGSTWTPSQFEDMKFTLYKADFTLVPGTLKLYNPELGVGVQNNPRLRRNAFEFLTQEIVVGLGSTVITRDFSIGSRMTQVGNQTAEGNVTKSLGAIKINTSATEAGGITTNTVGTGLTPAASNLTYTGIALTTITGNGSGATANIQVTSGSVGVVTVVSGGSGYAEGDVLGCDLGETGRNIRFNVGIISATNSLILDKVQGTFNTSSELMTINSVGVASTLTGSIPSAISNTEPYRDGLHFKVTQRNHGMHAANNKVTISGAIGVTSTSTVSTQYSNTSTTDVEIAAVGLFASFENVGVSTTNPGYAKINDEIIEYTGVDAGSTPQKLTGITRGIDNTVAQIHRVGDLVTKYEASGISLRRINKTHSFAEIANNVPRTLDTYYLKVDTTSTGVGTVRDGTNSFPTLKISDTQNLGGSRARATQNIAFETLTPNIQFTAPKATNISGRVRTISGTSIDGNEVSFQDQGFETIDISGQNNFDSPRMIASKVNEQDKLSALPGSKSFTMELVLSTRDPNVSPVIDTDRMSVITTTNRLDQQITNFPDDRRVNSRFDDPNAAIYLSKRVNLQNPATLLQVKFSAYRDPSADFRVMYKLFRADSVDDQQTFELFPGYENLTDTTGDGFGDKVTDPKNNNGHPDALVPPAKSRNDFRDYQFTAKNLPEFSGFEIKVIMTGTNQAYPPKIKELRAIAFA